MSTLHPFTLPELVEQWIDARADAPALVHAEETLSYGSLAERTRGMASRLAALGVRKGDRVCLHVPKSVLEAVSTYAIASLGAVVTNVNVAVTARQLWHVLEDSGARVLVTHGRRAEALAAEGLPASLDRIVLVDGEPGGGSAIEIALEELPSDGALPRPRIVDGDPCALVYTSGSTGLPKGVVLSHMTVVQSARAAATHLRNSRDDRALSVLPLSFDYGLSQLTTMGLVGGTLVLPRASLAKELLETIRAHDVNGIAMVPTMWIPFVRLLRDEGVTLEAIRYVANSGGPLPTDVQRSWPVVFPRARHYLMYGMTEGFRSSYLPPEDFERKLGSIGIPLPNVELFVVDPERGVCGPGEHGELLHRSRSLMSDGYFRAPEATAEKFKPSPHLHDVIGDEPVLHSGDTVYRDEEGYLWFVARTSTFIKCSDFRVSPTEVEDLVFSSGMVTDVVAFGRPDELLGEVVEIALSPKDLAAFDEAELSRYCRRTMPRYMVPRAIHVWKEPLPRTGNAKVDRPAVIARHRGD